MYTGEKFPVSPLAASGAEPASRGRGHARGASSAIAGRVSSATCIARGTALASGSETAALRWEPKRRIPSLDALRGIAALAVVVHHAGLQRLPIPRHAAYAPGVNILYPVIFWMGTWGVTLFFVLSGFVIHLPQARREREGAPFIGWKEFYRRRARRLLPTHYASIAFAVAAASIAPTDLISRPTIATLLAHVFMVHTWATTAVFYSINAVFWSIAVEVHFYLTYPLLLWIRRRFGRALLPTLLAIAFAVYLASYAQPSLDRRFIIQNLFLVTWWIWGMGVVMADVYSGGELPGSARLLVFPGAVWVWGALSLAVAYVDPTVASAHVRFWIAPVLCAVVLFAAAIGTTRAHARLLEWLGDFSYSLYLMHPVALAITSRLLPAGVLPGPVAAVADIAASIVVARLFFLLVERRFLNTQRRPEAA
jgi:peptidoglycan/LPS O-acetylase OafA/YrhL